MARRIAAVGVLAALALPAWAAGDHAGLATLGATHRFSEHREAYLSFDLHPANCDTARRATVRFEVTGRGRTRSVGGHDQCETTLAQVAGSGRGWKLESFGDDLAYEFHDYSARTVRRRFSYRFSVGGRLVERGTFDVVRSGVTRVRRQRLVPSG